MERGHPAGVMFDKISRLFERLHAYSAWQVALELAIIWIVVYAIIRFVQGTRAAGALKGTLLLFLLATLVVRILGTPEEFQRLKFLYDNFLTLLAVTLIVVFQPELRRGLIRLGEAPLLRRTSVAQTGVVDAIAEACGYLSRARFGAIIVIERQTPLKGLVEGGTPIHGQVTARLLQTIFFPGSALHDLAVVVQGDQIKGAGVQLPLADPDEMPDPTLGSRHRAAVGLSKECDALVVVVSEETGNISIAQRGRLDQNLGVDRLRTELVERLARGSVLGALVAAPPANGVHDPNADSVHAHDLSDPRD